MKKLNKLFLSTLSATLPLTTPLIALSCNPNTSQQPKNVPQSNTPTEYNNNPNKNQDHESLLVIPQNITTIKANQYFNNLKIKNVIIPNNVKRIEINAFKNCYNLEKVYIADSVDAIDDSAFENCINLKIVKLPVNLTYLSISRNLFKGCINLQKINRPPQLTAINEKAFAGCVSLIGPDLGITRSGSYYNNNSTSYRMWKKGNAKIAANAFEGCTLLVES